MPFSLTRNPVAANVIFRYLQTAHLNAVFAQAIRFPKSLSDPIGRKNADENDAVAPIAAMDTNPSKQGHKQRLVILTME